VTHASSYAAIWHQSVHQVPWFIEPTFLHKPVSKTVRANVKEPYENPVFRGEYNEDDEVHLTLSNPSLALDSYNVDLERLSRSSTRQCIAPLPAESQESLRPMWAKQVGTRRGIDLPFAPVPVAQRVSRLVKSCWRTSSIAAPPPPPPKLDLRDSTSFNGGFLDCHRASYGFFPDSVPDQDKPIAQTRMNEWVQAHP
jgi:hypothetical protein